MTEIISKVYAVNKVAKKNIAAATRAVAVAATTAAAATSPNPLYDACLCAIPFQKIENAYQSYLNRYVAYNWCCCIGASRLMYLLLGLLLWLKVFNIQFK